MKLSVVHGETKLSEIKEHIPLPAWWIERVIIEYFDCRHFCIGQNFSSIDYNLLSAKDVNKIQTFNVVVSSGTILFHNITRDQLEEQLSAIRNKEISSNMSEVIVEGLANSKAIPISLQSYDEWDPKLGFNDYCIVNDEGRFFQWKIADVINSDSNKTWRSDILNLGHLYEINSEICNSINDYKNGKVSDIITIRTKGQQLYKQLEDIRQPIRTELLKYHESKIVEHKPLIDELLQRLHFPLNEGIKRSDLPRRIAPHYSRQLIVPASHAYDYYSDIESYPKFYPEYCKSVKVIHKSNNTLITKEIWNFPIDIKNIKNNKIVLFLYYHFIPQKEIQYEVLDGYPEAIGIKNKILLAELDNDNTSVEGNNIILDMILFPPHKYSPTIESFQFKMYHEKIDYFIMQDCIYLEEKRVWCPTCKEGFLEKSHKLGEESSLDGTHRVRTEVWICNKCGKELTHYGVSSIDKIKFND